MKSKQHAFFNGYIIFLCFCLLIRILGYLGIIIEFGFWNRIVIAVTVSTCFFCIADAMKQYNDLKELISIKSKILESRSRSIAERSLEILENILKKEEPDYIDKKAEGDRLVTKAMDLIHGEEERKTPLAKKTIYCINMSGFIVFLLLVSFDHICQILLPYQDILTLFAFVIVLISFVYYEHKAIPINTNLEKMVEELNRIDLVYTIIEIQRCKEDKNNGKNENAHP